MLQITNNFCKSIFISVYEFNCVVHGRITYCKFTIMKKSLQTINEQDVCSTAFMHICHGPALLL